MDFGQFLLFVFFVVIPFILVVAGYWKTFEKAGWPGWWSIIPILNQYVIVKIANKPWWWLILLFIPIVGFFTWIFMGLEIARLFGRGVWFAIGLILVPWLWFLILGWGVDEYEGLKRGEA